MCADVLRTEQPVQPKSDAELLASIRQKTRERGRIHYEKHREDRKQKALENYYKRKEKLIAEGLLERKPRGRPRKESC